MGLAAFDASLAISFDRPTPTEQVRLSSSATRRRIKAAMAGPSPSSCLDPVTSRKASSREMPSTSGVTDSKISCSFLLSSMYRWKRPSTKTAWGQSRRATDEGMAEWTPNMRAS